jgi:predicted nuclease of predicted toxin-antitoxin system
MKLLFDQNLSHRLIARLVAEFPGSEHIRNLGMAASPDADVWAFAATHNYVIVSKDADFQHRALLHGHPPKVIWVRIGNCSTTAIAALLQNRLLDIEAFEVDPASSFLVLS